MLGQALGAIQRAVERLGAVYQSRHCPFFGAKKPDRSWSGLKKAKGGSIPQARPDLTRLLNLFVESVALEVRVVFLLLNALGHGLFVARGEVAGHGFTFFAGFRAFEDDLVLHVFERV